jgi:rRNA maturation endonuclease Nob1
MPKEAVATIDVAWKIRVVCHNCGKGFKPKPGDDPNTCPACQRNGHHGDAQTCRACANEREYR